MKKITSLLAAAALCFTCLMAQAQTTETKEKSKVKGSMAQEGAIKPMAMQSGMMMAGGKMMVMKDGKTTAMTEDMSLPNGTKVMKDGSVKMADGSTVMMHDGDHMSMDGKLMHHHKDGNHGDMKVKSGNTKMKSTDEKLKIEGQGEKVKTKYDK